MSTGPTTGGAVATEATQVLIKNETIAVIQLLDTISSVLTYVGTAVAGSATSAATWRIKKLGYSGADLVSVLYADGNTNFDNVWDNRAALSYS